MASSTQRITADSLVEEVVDLHPETILVFARHGLKCVGCYIAPFHTIADIAREYGVGVEPLLGALNRSVASGHGAGCSQALQPMV